jgi:hypothetical protein
VRCPVFVCTNGSSVFKACCVGRGNAGVLEASRDQMDILCLPFVTFHRAVDYARELALYNCRYDS